MPSLVTVKSEKNQQRILLRNAHDSIVESRPINTLNEYIQTVI